MGKVIDFPAREAVKGPWIIYVGRLSEGERIDCRKDGGVQIYTESLDRLPFLIERGKRLVAAQRAAGSTTGKEEAT